MESTSHLLASGPGWSVRDIVCTAGPHDRAFEEQHDAVCIAVVTHGTFQYRSRLGAAVLAPGAVLLGNEGYCFECGTFRQVVGITPHQFVLRTRLHRAAVRLRRTDESIAAIAFDAGFSDLSTFNRRFRRVMGLTPTAYRAGGAPPFMTGALTPHLALAYSS